MEANATRKKIYLCESCNDKGEILSEGDYNFSKNSDNWKAKAIEGAAGVRATFLREKVDVVLAADENYLRFQETTPKVIAPKGVRRVGSGECCGTGSEGRMHGNANVGVELIEHPTYVDHIYRCIWSETNEKMEGSGGKSSPVYAKSLDDCKHIYNIPEIVTYPI